MFVCLSRAAVHLSLPARNSSRDPAALTCGGCHGKLDLHYISFVRATLKYKGCYRWLLFQSGINRFSPSLSALIFTFVSFDPAPLSPADYQPRAKCSSLFSRPLPRCVSSACASLPNRRTARVQSDGAHWRSRHIVSTVTHCHV